MEIPKGFFKNVQQQIKEAEKLLLQYERELRENYSESLDEDIKNLKETIQELNTRNEEE